MLSLRDEGWRVECQVLLNEIDSKLGSPPSQDAIVLNEGY